MTTTATQTAVICPACSPDTKVVHEVLKEQGQATVKCTECGQVHKTQLSDPSEHTVNVIISQEDESFTATTTVTEGETKEVGDEFIVEAQEGLFTAQITSVETKDGSREDDAVASEVQTLWTRAVGNVAVPITVHPKEGTRDGTYSTKVYVPGDFEFEVGKEIDVEDEAFIVEGIHIRDEATNYDHQKLDYQGDSAIAKDIKRIYGRDQTTEAWSPW
ncbi:hypothetical protein K0C01_00985 [Salinarchaeum sp. IM2453]|uniref:HVO_0476 family zinc finger protein n=1 Tax=Salinarchaeum sp. IM2453 TaxID=2862870 RepID=UPI001C82FA6C|nr:HVO_0476 family zinc finger protein [Salinarchaeum sp. IM2453]QZA88775.1 hypothetical protein K0C01_00985 [Salinarchaeum sp. IM2453]